MQLHEPTLIQGRALQVTDLGEVPYADCWHLQNDLATALGRGERSETLLLLEHPHTYTCGRRGGRDHILISEEELARRGVTVLDVDRGGDVTYHGPGQLVAYPIIELSRRGAIDYPGYVRTLERVLIDTLADFDISSYQVPGYSGVWVRVGSEEAKIAAIGVKVDGRGVTTHGIALNVSTDLQYFDWIVPCGITDKGVTSMTQVLGIAPAISLIKQSFAGNFARVFGFDVPSR
jgi:lipoate-protein ligase B